MGILDESYKECSDHHGDHYKNIAIRPMAYGQSLALIALVEALI